jgi:uncharacterized protein (TIGR00730 family)
MVVGKRPRPDGRPPGRRPYRTGDEALDAKIAEIIEESGVEDPDLVREMVTTCFRVAKDRADRGEMKLVNAALKEFAYAFKVFKRYRGARKVSMFGSSRSGPGDPEYEWARQFAKAISERGWMVITGAGPGIMEAGHEGAGAERSFGAAIRLPMEVEPNVVIEGDPKLINFKYFFTRKVTFLKESDAFAMFPGGFGTLDEAFELLTLMQTGKSDLHPIVLLETPGGQYWADWRRFMEERLQGRGLISAEDLDLVKITDSIEAAIDEIERFYSNYHSQRFVDGTLVLRLQRLPDGAALQRLSMEFADILRADALRPVEASLVEVEEGDSPDLARLALDFNQRSYGRLRQLIDALNGF